MKTKLLAFFTFLLMSSMCHAQMNVLYNFTNGGSPYGALLLSGNVFYGTTYNGGINNQGSVFSINKDGSGFKDLWDFKDSASQSNGNANGEYSYSTLVLIGNRLYGMTYEGGANNEGVIFSVNKNGGGYKDLWDFNSPTGYTPYGSLLLVRDKFYGLASSGGANNNGCVFSIDTNGTAYTDMYDFSYASGYGPRASLVCSGKSLFGTTLYGGVAGNGTLFSIDTTGNNYKIKVNFSNSIGDYSYATLILSPNGTRLFGTAQDGGGGYGDGAVFGVDTDGTNFKDIVDFNYLDGEEPVQVILVGNKLFGMTDYNAPPYEQGNIFSVDTTGAGFNIVHNFEATDGSYPYWGNSLIALGDTLYGMVDEGGTQGYGVIFDYINSPSGIDNISSNNAGISVYPNPSTGKFQLKIDNGQVTMNSAVEVYNMLGEEVYSSTLSTVNSTLSIDLGNQANGIYFYRLISAEGNMVGEGKLVLQK